MQAESSATTAVGTLHSPGAESFYRHTRDDFLEAGYEAAPPRIRAALAAEIDFLRRTLAGQGRVLEIGCGHGRLLAALHDSVGQWVGLDLLEGNLRRARARGLARTSLVAGRAEGLPFQDEAFDAVICPQATLGLLGEGKLPAIREARRVTRGSGQLVFVVYSDSSAVPRVEWYREMHRRGLLAPIDWARSGPELLITADGHASECFRRERLEQLFAGAGLTPRLERLGEIYWVAQARRI